MSVSAVHLFHIICAMLQHHVVLSCAICGFHPRKVRIDDSSHKAVSNRCSKCSILISYSVEPCTCHFLFTLTIEYTQNWIPTLICVWDVGSSIPLETPTSSVSGNLEVCSQVYASNSWLVFRPYVFGWNHNLWLETYDNSHDKKTATKSTNWCQWCTPTKARNSHHLSIYLSQEWARRLAEISNVHDLCRYSSVRLVDRLPAKLVSSIRAKVSAQNCQVAEYIFYRRLCLYER